MKTFLQPTATTLLDRATALSRARVPFVLATVVRAQRPTTAHAGDIALLHADGWIDGFVGGAGIETALREHGARVLVTNEPLLLRIVSTEVLVPQEEGTVTVVDPMMAGGALEVFLEARLPAPRVLVTGDTPLVRAMSTLGTMLGFAVEEVDGWGVSASQQPSAHDAAFIVASTGRGETRMIESALSTGVPYIGLVASAERSATVLADLEATEEQLSRVHAPAGLDIGATTAPEIALALFAQIVAQLKRAPSAAPAPHAEAAEVVEEPPADVVEQPAPVVAAEDLEPAVTRFDRSDALDFYSRVSDDEDAGIYGRDRSARPPLNAVRERDDELTGSRRERGSHQAAPVAERGDEPMTISFDRGDVGTRVRTRPSASRLAADPAVG